MIMTMSLYDAEPSISEDYKGRVSLSGQASLTLSKIIAKDNGIFECRIIGTGTSYIDNRIQVIAKGEKMLVFEFCMAYNHICATKILKSYFSSLFDQ